MTENHLPSGPSAPSSPPARATDETLQRIRSQVPGELLLQPRWIGWDGTRKPNGKLDKGPIDPRSGQSAKSNDPATWGSFDDACVLAIRDPRVGGLAFVLTDSAYWALDLDHVINLGTGEIAPEARRFLDQIEPTYIEHSPSGDGLHVLYRGRRPSVLAATKAKDAFGPGRHLEVFGGGSARYVTVTGQAWTDGAPFAAATDKTIESVLAMFPPPPSTAPAIVSLTAATIDEEERKVRRALRTSRRTTTATGSK